jgi:arsenate reductase
MSSIRNTSVHQTIVFACSDDIGRAQIACAWFGLLADPRKARAVLALPSARGGPRILPDVLAALRESGLELTTIRARELTSHLVASADLIVTMGGTFARRLLGGAAPFRREHWLVPSAGDAGDRDRARSLRDLIRSRVAMLVFSEGWGRADLSRETARVTRTRRTSETFAAL